MAANFVPLFRSRSLLLELSSLTLRVDTTARLVLRRTHDADASTAGLSNASGDVRFRLRRFYAASKSRCPLPCVRYRVCSIPGDEPLKRCGCCCLYRTGKHATQFKFRINFAFACVAAGALFANGKAVAKQLSKNYCCVILKQSPSSLRKNSVGCSTQPTLRSVVCWTWLI